MSNDKIEDVRCLTDLTPTKFACSQAVACPAVLKSNEDSYVIIGQICDTRDPALTGRVGPQEMAVEISAKLVNGAIKASFPRYFLGGFISGGALFGALQFASSFISLFF